MASNGNGESSDNDDERKLFLLGVQLIIIEVQEVITLENGSEYPTSSE